MSVAAVRLTAAAVSLAATPSLARGQARPAGAGRAWGALALEGAGQAQRCRGCVRPGTRGGPALSLAAGYTLPRGFGVALQGRAFSAFDIEYGHTSQYMLALGQYAPGGLAPLTFNAGAGWGRHRGGPAPSANDGQGAVLAAGVGVRLPRRSVVALSLTADVVQAVGGPPGYRPRLVSVGVGVSAATSSRAGAGRG